MAKRSWVRTAITATFYVVLVVFLGIYIWNIDYSAFADLELDLRFLMVAAVLAIGFRYWQAYIWITVLRGLGARDVTMSIELTEVYAKSWLGRYIPGTAPWILGKIYFASQHGVSKSKLAVGSLLEGAIQIAVLLTTSIVLLLLDPRLDVLPDSVTIAMVLVVVGAVIGLTPAVFNWLMFIAFRLLRRRALAEQNRVGARTIVVAALQYVVGAALSGLSLLFIVTAVYPSLDWSNAVFIVATANLAGAVSMLAVFAPGGIGIREGIQLLLLTLVLPGAVALTVVVLTRLWGIAMDLVFFGLGRGALFLKDRGGQSPGGTQQLE